MKKVFYSELTNKYYDSFEECAEAEKQVKEAEDQKKQELAKQEEKKAEISKEKKAMATAVERAESELDYAYTQLEVAKEKASKIYSEAKEQANEIYKKAEEEMQAVLKDAKQAVTDAQEKKFKAVRDFNNKFGVYTTTYSGNKALEELKRANSWINDIFNGFFF